MEQNEIESLGACTDALGEVLVRTGVMRETTQPGGERTLVPTSKPMTRGTLTEAARAVSVVAANRNTVNSLLSRGQRYIIAKAGKLPVDARRAIQEETAIFQVQDFYFRKQLASGGSNTSQQIIESKDDKTPGLRNLQGNRMPKTTSMAITGLKISYGQDPTATVTDASAVSYSNAMDAQPLVATPVTMPLGFLNGEVELRIGRRIIGSWPIKKFFRDGLSVSGEVEGGSDTVIFPVPVPWFQEEEIFLEVTYAGTLPNTANHFIEARVMGDGVAY